MNKMIPAILLALCLLLTLLPAAATALEKLPIKSSTCVYDGEGHTLEMGEAPAGTTDVQYKYTDEEGIQAKSSESPYFINAGVHTVVVQFYAMNGDAGELIKESTVTVTIEKATPELYFTPGNIVFAPGEKSRQLEWVYNGEKNGGGRLYFTSSDSRHFWVDPSGGLVSLNQEGGVSIWVTAPETGNYKGATAMCIVETESTLPQIDIDTKLEYSNPASEILEKKVTAIDPTGKLVTYVDIKCFDRQTNQVIQNAIARPIIKYETIFKDIPQEVPKAMTYDFTVLHQLNDNTVETVPFTPLANGLHLRETTLSPFAIVYIPKENYTLYYEANGGTGTPMYQRVKMDSDDYSVRVSSVQPRREGFYFKGWSIGGPGDVEVMPGDILTLDKDIVLYAVWDKASMPQTGDHSRMGLWLTLLLASALAFACVQLRRRSA